MSDDATTVGTWMNAREQEKILEPFDEAVEAHGMGRSEGIKRAMQLYTMLLEILAEQPWKFANEREERLWVRQAVQNEIRRDIERDT